MSSKIGIRFKLYMTFDNKKQGTIIMELNIEGRNTEVIEYMMMVPYDESFIQSYHLNYGDRGITIIDFESESAKIDELLNEIRNPDSWWESILRLNDSNQPSNEIDIARMTGKVLGRISKKLLRDTISEIKIKDAFSSPTNNN